MKYMKAITIIPKEKGSAKLMEVPVPSYKKNEVLVRVLDAGICRTDLEIYEGLYGETPVGENYLIMGHESLGVIEKVGRDITTLRQGNLVARTVRRQCIDMCINCRNDEQDMCLTGNYVETGIKGLHGVMAEYYVDSPKNLVRVQKKFADFGVLMEPLSFSEKAVRQTYLVGERMSAWEPKKALVIGAGPIGLLEAMILRAKGLDTYVAAWSKEGNNKSGIVSEIGARYVSVQEKPLNTLGKFDIIIESSGTVEMIGDAMQQLNTNGVLCLTSITGGERKLCLPLEKINIDFVLGNKSIVGAVNASMKDYSEGKKHLHNFESLWPGVTKKLITRRVNPENYLAAFEKKPGDIKTVIEFT
ncbi:MAG: glucose 1-dehydrogenase [Candidatus Woesearchaeota archaeon]